MEKQGFCSIYLIEVIETIKQFQRHLFFMLGDNVSQNS